MHGFVKISCNSSAVLVACSVVIEFNRACCFNTSQLEYILISSSWIIVPLASNF